MESRQYFLDQNTGLSYAIVPESGAFDSLQTLVEVSSILADQDENIQVISNEVSTIVSQPRHTILAQRIVDTVESHARSSRPGPEMSQPPQDKPTRRRGSGAAQVRPCQVCGEVAGRHSYYGGEVCPSCRAFFRRSVQSGYNVSYCCVKNEDCTITLRTRKNCQFCRYKRCLDVGMKTTWVLSEDERKKKFEGKKISRKKKNDKENDEDTDEPLSGDFFVITDEETSQVNYLINLCGYYEQSKVSDMETDLIRDIIRMVAFRHPLPEEGQSQLRNVLTRRFFKIAKKIKEIQALPLKDREEITQKNIPSLVELQICTFFNPDLLWQEQLTSLVGSEEVEKLNKKLKSLRVAALDDYHISYSDMFRKSLCDKTENFLEIIRDIGSWPQDPFEYVLISMMMLFCTDLLQVKHHVQIQNFQNKYATLLYKYLNKKHKLEPGVAVSRFAGGINTISKCKLLQSIQLKLLKVEV